MDEVDVSSDDELDDSDIEYVVKYINEFETCEDESEKGVWDGEDIGEENGTEKLNHLDKVPKGKENIKW